MVFAFALSFAAAVKRTHAPALRVLYATAAAAADVATLAGAAAGGATLAATRIRPVSRALRASKAQIHFVCK